MHKSKSQLLYFSQRDNSASRKSMNSQMCLKESKISLDYFLGTSKIIEQQ